MKVQELFEALRFIGDNGPQPPKTRDASLTKILIQDKGNGEFLVSVKETKGPMLHALYKVVSPYFYHGSKFITGSSIHPGTGGVTVMNRSGGELKSWPRTPLNGYVLKFKNPEGAKEKLEGVAEKAIEKQRKELKSSEKHKAEAPQRKKEMSKLYAADAKKKNADRDVKYGKGTAKRVKYFKHGGDDEYSYVVTSDGRIIDSGLSRGAAEHSAVTWLDHLAQKELLGMYSPEHKDVFIKRLLTTLKHDNDGLGHDRVVRMIDIARDKGYDYSEFKTIEKSLGRPLRAADREED